MSFIKKAVKKVFSVAKKVVKKVVKTVKRAVKSKWFKYALMAAAIVFTAGVAAGGFAAFSGVSTVGGFFGAVGQTMATGWTAITGAFGATAATSSSSFGAGTLAGTPYAAATAGGLSPAAVHAAATAGQVLTLPAAAAGGQALGIGVANTGIGIGGAGFAPAVSAALPGVTGSGMGALASASSSILASTSATTPAITEPVREGFFKKLASNTQRAFNSIFNRGGEAAEGTKGGGGSLWGDFVRGMVIAGASAYTDATRREKELKRLNQTTVALGPAFGGSDQLPEGLLFASAEQPDFGFGPAGGGSQTTRTNTPTSRDLSQQLLAAPAPVRQSGTQLSNSLLATQGNQLPTQQEQEEEEDLFSSPLGLLGRRAYA
jgi:hypothetical protein